MGNRAVAMGEVGQQPRPIGIRQLVEGRRQVNGQRAGLRWKQLLQRSAQSWNSVGGHSRSSCRCGWRRSHRRLPGWSCGRRSADSENAQRCQTDGGHLKSIAVQPTRSIGSMRINAASLLFLISVARSQCIAGSGSTFLASPCLRRWVWTQSKGGHIFIILSTLEHLWTKLRLPSASRGSRNIPQAA